MALDSIIVELKIELVLGAPLIPNEISESSSGGRLLGIVWDDDLVCV
jgi:hypothetical protein